MKRLVNTKSTDNPPQAGRAGTTLVELLISILLMGIGLATLMVLYPAAIFRTVRANQLTNGTILRYNAETQLDLFPFDTIFNDHFNLSPGFNPRLTTDDDPQFLVLDPLGYIAAHDEASEVLASSYGHDDADNATGIKRIAFLLADEGAGFPASTLAGIDKHVDLNLDGTIANNNYPTGDVLTRDFLRGMVTLPDSWEEFITTTVDTSTPPTTTSVTLDSDADLTDLATITEARIVLFSADNRGGHVQPIDSITGQTVNWLNALPASFSPASVRIEVPSSKFTWLMTLRREGLADPLADPLTETFSTQNQADLVVFFNRSFDIEDEHIHDSTGLPASAIRRGEPEVFLSDDGNLVDPPAEGNFIFDVDNCRWYKVVRVDEVNGYYNLTIDRNAVANSENVMLIRNVVDVYPLDPFTTSIPPGP